MREDIQKLETSKNYKNTSISTTLTKFTMSCEFKTWESWDSIHMTSPYPTKTIFLINLI